MPSSHHPPLLHVWLTQSSMSGNGIKKINEINQYVQWLCWIFLLLCRFWGSHKSNCSNKPINNRLSVFLSFSVCLSRSHSKCHLSISHYICLLVYQQQQHVTLEQNNTVLFCCLSTCLSPCLSVCLPVCLSVCLYVFFYLLVDRIANWKLRAFSNVIENFSLYIYIQLH